MKLYIQWKLDLVENGITFSIGNNLHKLQRKTSFYDGSLVRASVTGFKTRSYSLNTYNDLNPAYMRLITLHACHHNTI